MPTLNIEGKRVKVDDSFMQLSPEEQAETVDEIAQTLGISAAQPADTAQPSEAFQSGLPGSPRRHNPLPVGKVKTT